MLMEEGTGVIVVATVGAITVNTEEDLSLEEAAMLIVMDGLDKDEVMKELVVRCSLVV